MEPTNLLFILSDQHSRDAMGCQGHPLVQTPALDRLAAGGTRFQNAYVNCPVCVPSRASLQTGRYVHDVRCWDNGIPYDGSVPGWGHRLREQGHRVDSIGKLHFRSAEDDNGLGEEVEPLHVVDGVGDVGVVGVDVFRPRGQEIGGLDHSAVGARVPGVPGQGDHVGGSDVAGAGDHRHAAVVCLDRDGGDPLALLGAHDVCLAIVAADDEAVDAFVDGAAHRTSGPNRRPGAASARRLARAG